MAQHPSLISFIGHRMREAVKWGELGVYSLSGAPRAGKLLVFPSNSPDEGSSRLRAYELVPELRRLGWRVLVVPKQLERAQRHRLAAAFAPDLMMVQKTVHPLNAASAIPDGRVVFDLDDADFLDPAHTSKIEALCRRADMVIAGSRYVAAWCRQYCPSVRIVWTGGPASSGDSVIKPSPKIVAWAIAFPENHREELEFVRRILLGVRARGLDFVFRQYGWKDLDVLHRHRKELESGGVKVETLGYCDYTNYQRSLRDVAVGLQPIDPGFPYGRGKSFGKLLGYMNARAAIVATNAADHSLFFESGRNAIIANALSEWIDAVCALLENEDLRKSLADAAYSDFLARLTSAASAALLSDALHEVMGKRRLGENEAKEISGSPA